MNPHGKLISRFVGPAAVVLALGASHATISAAGAANAAALSAIHIDNFAKVDDSYYRGSQPERSDYGDLSKLGVKTIIDLQADGSPREKGLVEHAGMAFYR